MPWAKKQAAAATDAMLNDIASGTFNEETCCYLEQAVEQSLSARGSSVGHQLGPILQPLACLLPSAGGDGDGGGVPVSASLSASSLSSSSASSLSSSSSTSTSSSSDSSLLDKLIFHAHPSPAAASRSGGDAPAVPPLARMSTAQRLSFCRYLKRLLASADSLSQFGWLHEALLRPLGESTTGDDAGEELAELHVGLAVLVLLRDEQFPRRFFAQYFAADHDVDCEAIFHRALLRFARSASHVHTLFCLLGGYLDDRAHRAKAAKLFADVVAQDGPRLDDVVETPALRAVLELLRRDSCELAVTTTLSAFTTLLPRIVDCLPAFLGDLFAIFKRILFWNAADLLPAAQSPGSPKPAAGRGQRDQPATVDAAVDVPPPPKFMRRALAAFFFHLYAVFPNNVVCYVRQECSQRREHHEAMRKAVSPLLGCLRMNPLLVHEDTESELELAHIRNRSRAAIAFCAMAGGTLPHGKRDKLTEPDVPTDPWKTSHQQKKNTSGSSGSGVFLSSSSAGSLPAVTRRRRRDQPDDEVAQLKAEVRFERHLRQQYLGQYVDQTRQLLQAEIARASLDEALLQLDEARRQLGLLQELASSHAVRARALEQQLEQQQLEFAQRNNMAANERRQLKDRLKKEQALSASRKEAIAAIQLELDDKNRLLLDQSLSEAAAAGCPPANRQRHQLHRLPVTPTGDDSGGGATASQPARLTADMLETSAAVGQQEMISSLAAAIERKDAELVALARKCDRLSAHADKCAEELASLQDRHQQLELETKASRNILAAQLAALEQRYATVKSINLHLQQRIQGQHQYIGRPAPQTDFSLAS